MGYITNYLGVKMLFYPLMDRCATDSGKSSHLIAGLARNALQALCQASNRMVDVTISQLLNVKEVFGRLSPKELAKILQGCEEQRSWGWLPGPSSTSS